MRLCACARSSTDGARVSDFVELHLLAPEANRIAQSRRSAKAGFSDAKRLSFSLGMPEVTSSDSSRPGSAIGTPEKLKAKELPSHSLLAKAYNSSPGLPVAAAARNRNATCDERIPVVRRAKPEQESTSSLLSLAVSLGNGRVTPMTSS
eukprot:366551-Chlamydomonas_euryale.AAC.15